MGVCVSDVSVCVSDVCVSDVCVSVCVCVHVPTPFQNVVKGSEFKWNFPEVDKTPILSEVVLTYLYYFYFNNNLKNSISLGRKLLCN